MLAVSSRAESEMLGAKSIVFRRCQSRQIRSFAGADCENHLADDLRREYSPSSFVASGLIRLEMSRTTIDEREPFCRPWWETVVFRLVKFATIANAVVVLGLSCYFLATSPVAFQKSVSICVGEQADLPRSPGAEDVGELIRRIPYQPSTSMVYDVSPRRKYQKTVEEGHGNCSNFAFGMAYSLSQRDIDYQIVHLLPPSGFLAGEGHTVLRMPYQHDGNQRVGIVDLYEGGLPRDGAKYLDLEDLRRAGLREPNIDSLHGFHDQSSPYYGDFLDRSIVGVIDRREVDSYNRFLEATYLPLGNAKLEKLCYDGIATVLGFYPKIQVTSGDYDRLFRGHQLKRVLALALLYFARSFLVLSFILVAMLGWVKLQSIRSRATAVGR